ncbi:MAG: hypothetical protein GY760_14105 [Deltaproteobacteria bacterium]|nr:hypothetical protein [Deltaproteobacteria bacterium]
MKKILYFLLISFLLSSCGSEPDESSPPLLLNETGLSTIELLALKEINENMALGKGKVIKRSNKKLQYELYLSPKLFKKLNKKSVESILMEFTFSSDQHKKYKKTYTTLISSNLKITMNYEKATGYIIFKRSKY